MIAMVESGESERKKIGIITICQARRHAARAAGLPAGRPAMQKIPLPRLYGIEILAML
jgi:hypothetical protein